MKKEFTAAAFDLKHEVFIVHIATLSVNSDDEMHPSRKAQMGHLKVDKALTKVPNEYVDFADVFSPKLAVELQEHTKINDHAIELVDDWQPQYGLFIALGL